MQPAIAKRLFLSVGWIVAMVMALCMTDSARAQTQQASCVITTRGGPSETLDITFLIECGSSEAAGALHFHVLSSAGPSASDRELEIVFAMAQDQVGSYSATHRTKVLLKEGASSVEGSMPLAMNNQMDPSGNRLQFWNVFVLEDERNIEALRGIQTMAGGAYVPARFAPGEPPDYMLLQRGTAAGIALHISESNASMAVLPTLSALGAVPGGIIQDSPVFDLFRDPLHTTSLRHANSLSETWFYYLQFRYLVVTETTLEEIKTQRPKVAEALKQYMAAGGSIVVIGSVDGDEAAIDQWLSAPDAKPEASDKSWERTFLSSTKFPLFKAAGDRLPDDPDAVAFDTPDEAQAAQAAKLRTVSRAYVRGRIYSVKGRLSGLGSKFVSDLPVSPGLTASNVYDEGWPLRNMIASVGKPPVWTFCTIILLFGLILGPGLLFLTGWIGRRSLLILLIPLVSLVATVAIVGYEVLHEGFGTYSRISSVVTVDAATGEGFAWSRQTYFSGWPPREGLKVPNDVFCRQVSAYSINRYGSYRGNPSNQYNVSHLPEHSVWTGVLPAREQRQFLIGHPFKASMPIAVTPIDALRIKVRNLTSGPLPFVLLRDGKDGYFFTEKLSANEEVELSSQPFDDISGAVSRMRSEHMPALPADVRSLGWGFNQNLSNVEVLDQSWSGSLSEQAATSTLKPFGFVTLTRSYDDIFVLLKSDSQESLTLVTGRVEW